MNFIERATDALEKAARQDYKPLHSLIGSIIARNSSLTPNQIDEIRSDVYLRLVGPINAGQPYIAIAAQLYTISVRARFDYLRRLKARGATVPLDDLPSESLLIEDSTATPSMFSISNADRFDRVARILDGLKNSSKRSDRRYFIAIMAHICGHSVFEELQRSNEGITPNNAAQILHRGLERVRSLYEAQQGKKAS